MVIKIDKEAEKVLSEIVDGFVKHTGLRGVGMVNKLMQSISILESTMNKVPDTDSSVSEQEKNVPIVLPGQKDKTSKQ